MGFTSYDQITMPSGRATVALQHEFHIGERQLQLQSWIVVKINLANRLILGGAPIGIHLVEQFRGEWVCFHSLIFFRYDFRDGLRPGVFGHRLHLRVPKSSDGYVIEESRTLANAVRV